MSPTEKKPTNNSVLMTEIVLPSHANVHGTIFGGVIMSWIDIAGAIAAARHSRSAVVTVSLDSLHFIAPVKVGYTVLVHASVTYAGSTSMEVEIFVEAENSLTGDVKRATTAFLTYVAVDEFGRPRQVPPFTPKTALEKKKHKEAAERRKIRLRAKSG